MNFVLLLLSSLLLLLLLLLLFYGAVDYLDIFRIQAYAIKCAKRAIFGVDVLSTFDSSLIILVIKIKVLELESGSFNHESHFK